MADASIDRKTLLRLTKAELVERLLAAASTDDGRPPSADPPPGLSAALISAKAHVPDIAPMAMAVADDQGRLIYVNDAFVALWGYTSPGEALGRSAVEFWEASSEPMAVMRRLQETGRWDGRMRGVRADGTSFVAEVVSSLHGAPSGDGHMLVAAFREWHPSAHAHGQTDGEDRLATAIALLPYPLAIVRVSDGATMLANASFQRLLEARDAEPRALFPDDAAREALARELAEAGGIRQMELSLAVGGKERVFLVGVQATVYLGLPALLLAGMDITERSRSESLLREDAWIFEHAQRIGNFGLWSRNFATNELRWSAETFRIMGLEPHEGSVPFSTLLERVHPEDRPEFESIIRRSGVEPVPLDYVVRIVRPDGVVRTVHQLGATIQDDDGRPLRRIGTIHDITERVEAEDQLKRSEARQRAILDALPDMMLTVSRDGSILDFHAAESVRMPGSDQGMVGRNALDLLPPGMAELAMTAVHDALASGKLQRFEYQHRGRTRARDFEVRMVPLSPDSVLAVVRDTTERKEAERELRASEARYQTLTQLAPVGIFRADAAGAVQYVNERWCDLTGLEVQAALGDGWQAALHPDDRQAWLALWRQGLATGEPFQHEFRLQPPEGSPRWVLAQVEPQFGDNDALEGLLGSITDITTRKDLEEQLRQSQRIEAVGRLAGGVAHEFNNILQGILGFTELSLEMAQPGDPYRRNLERIRDGAEKAAQLTRQLLAFGRRQVMRTIPMDLNDLVRTMVPLLEATLGEAVRVDFRPGENLPSILADPSLVEQVVLNLSINGRDAMPTGGVLSLTTSLARFNEADRIEQPWTRPGIFVCIAVTDTGTGMAEEVLPHIFEPFFSTKGPQKGSGLGLSLVHGLVEQHRGLIDVQSQPGAGSTFLVYFPAEAPVGIEPEAASQTKPRRTVLLAEDEAAVRDLVHTTLAQAGFEVLEAPDGERAWQLFQEQSGSIDALVVDLIMPGMNGRELYERVRERSPHLPVVFHSGYSPSTEDARLARAPGVRFLRKPYRPVELRDALTALLGE